MMIYFWLIILLVTMAVLALLLTPLLRQKNYRAAAAIGSCIAIGSLGLYLLLGQPNIIEEMQFREELQASFSETAERLSTELKQNPKQPKKLVQLGEIWAEMGNYGKAAEAFRQAVLLTRGEPELIFRYAKALTLANGGTVTEDAKKGFEMTLTLLPEHREAAFFLAVERMQAGDKIAAKKQFEALLQQLPPEAPMARMIKRFLEKLG